MRTVQFSQLRVVRAERRFRLFRRVAGGFSVYCVIILKIADTEHYRSSPGRAGGALARWGSGGGGVCL